MKKTIVSLLAGVALTIGSSVSVATLCSAPGSHPDGLDVSDVTFNSANATECNGVFPGQATASTIGFDGFSAVASAAAGGSGVGSFHGENFTLATSGGTLGTWSLAWDGVTGPITLDLVAVVQTATTFASYFFDDLVLSVSPGSGKGDWVINFLVNEDFPLLTSFSLYARDFRSSTPPTEPPPPTSDVAEPATLALFALATLALGLARRMPGKKRR